MTTKNQIYRAYRKLWESVTAFDGYQPWGYDERTLALTKPGFMAARKRLQTLYRKAKA
jgi:hypothetical protein